MATFGRYEILNRIGLGGMGEVYRAKAIGIEGFERPVAVKVILPELGDDPGFQAMFVDEAKIAMHIQHANVVQVLDLGEADGRYYIVMELVDGTNLSRILGSARKKVRPLPAPLALHVMMEVLKGLDFAHKVLGPDGDPLKVVHRDVSPANILVSIAGEVKLSDFGIARATTRVQHTDAGVVRGKLSFMSPEQLAGKNIGPWTDVWAAAVVLLCALGGKHPFDGVSEADVLERLRNGHFPPPSALSTAIPVSLDPIVARALAPRYRERYASAGEFLSALEDFVHATKMRMGSRLLAEYVCQLFAEELGAQGRNAKAPEETPTTANSVSKHSSSAISLNEIWEAENRPPRLLAPGVTVSPKLVASRPRRWTLALSAAAVCACIGAGWIGGREVRERERDLRTGALRPDRPADAPMGWLDVEAFPWAEVTVDGEPKGVTPISGLALDPGPHLLEYRTADGTSGRTTVQVRAGRTTVSAPR